MLKINKKDYNEIDIYYINYVTVKKIANCNNIISVNPLYLMIDQMIGHFECKSIECNSVKCNSIEEKYKTKYLVLDDVDENKEVLKKYEEVWEGTKKEIETINGGKKIEYGEDFKDIKFKSNAHLPLNKPIKLLLLTIILRSVFSKDGKFYPHLFLDDALYEL